MSEEQAWMNEWMANNSAATPETPAPDATPAPVEDTAPVEPVVDVVVAENEAIVDPKEEQQEKSWRGRLEKEQSAVKQEKLDLATQRQELADMMQVFKEAQTPAAPAPVAIPEDDLTEIVDSLKAEFGDEFPDRLTRMATAIAKKIAAQEVASLREQVQSFAPVAGQVKDMAQSKLLTELAKAHPDWEQHWGTPELNEWFSSKPPRMQQALKESAYSSDVHEVIGFFNQYNLEKSIGKTPQELPKPATPGLSSQAQDKLKSAIAVPNHRASSAPTSKGKADPDDLNQAWADYQAGQRT